ncbi:phospholipase B1, membrane-associated-like [Schistocerca piceifrons]|uniref:phospholipase B1, membrane-associated-like n=1 Tax=Schistocerca piceifrons TaxID=274613 RepID=UPI001F5E5EAD|nr:phospholipase B1, membrane-associated-like [Schistocerca piceifrons]
MRTLSLVVAVAYCFLSLPAGPGQVLSYAGQIAFQIDPPSLIAFYESFKNVLSRTLRPKDRAKFLETLRQRKALQPEVPSDRPFPCDTRLGRSPSPPDSVHRLRPGDIDVIAALGDSLTAGNGILAANIMQVLAENRGASWSIGGEGSWRQFLTLPNILKEFNPRLVGFSLNDSSGHEKASQFNVGEIYATSRDLPWQAQLLVRRMRAHPDVDVQRHWKLVTILIGANDFCNELCVGDTARHAVEDHRRDLVAAVDCLREQLPRTLVNVVVVPNLELLRNFTGRTSECAALVALLCPCIFQSRQQHRLPEFIEVMRRWQQVEVDVAADSRYDGLSDFAVVSQPFAKNATFPTVSLGYTDFSYFSPDCFHFIQKAHARAANALWNNMLEPVGYKSVDWEEPFTRFLCPSEERPYIYTGGNSDL